MSSRKSRVTRTESSRTYTGQRARSKESHFREPDKSACVRRRQKLQNLGGSCRSRERDRDKAACLQNRQRTKTSLISSPASCSAFGKPFPSSYFFFCPTHYRLSFDSQVSSEELIRPTPATTKGLGFGVSGFRKAKVVIWEWIAWSLNAQ